MRNRIFSLLVMLGVIAMPLAVAMLVGDGLILGFVFFYPLLMSAMWMTGGLYFYVRMERRWKWGEQQQDREVPPLPGSPQVSIIISCFNKGRSAEATLLAALQQRYSPIEVLAVNDGSTDETAQILDQLAGLHPRLRVLHLSENQGKAMALRMGALAANSEYLVCIDGDAILDPDAVTFLVRPMLDTPRVGAVTGNPRVRSRSTLVGMLQVGEASSITGLIKRTQRIYGQVFSVSGAVAAFRRQALDRVGYWSLDMVTEDSDICWKLQRDHWSVFYEPRALAWVLMPETWHGLWTQRLRWAQGGAEIFLKNFDSLRHWRNRRMWPLLAGFTLSTLWAYAFALSILLYVVGLCVQLPAHFRVDTLLPPAFTGLVLAFACLLQFSASVTINQRYEKRLTYALLWVIWHPFVFWMVHLATSLVSFPRIMLHGQRQQRSQGQSAPWHPAAKRLADAALPQEISTATMVIRTQRSKLRHAVDVVLTLLAWLAFAYLFVQGIWAIGSHHVVGLDMPFLSNALPSIKTLSIYALALLLQGLLLVSWAIYNRHRFRSQPRRNADIAVSDESLIRSYDIDAPTLQRLRTQPILVIYHTADGSIAAVEPLWSSAGKSSEQAHSARQPPALV